MTQPAQTVNLETRADVVASPNGPMVAWRIGQGPMALTVVLPDQVAVEFGHLILRVLTDAADKARRARMGIVLPSDPPPPPAFGPLNGRQVQG